MPDRGQGRIVRVALLALAAGAILPGLAIGQQAGHGTVPSTGAAAPGGFPVAGREADPVVARIDELRRALGELAKEYKKAKGERRTQAQADILAGLARAQEEVGAARAKLDGKTD